MSVLTSFVDNQIKKAAPVQPHPSEIIQQGVSAISKPTKKVSAPSAVPAPTSTKSMNPIIDMVNQMTYQAQKSQEKTKEVVNQVIYPNTQIKSPTQVTPAPPKNNVYPTQLPSNVKLGSVGLPYLPTVQDFGKNYGKLETAVSEAPGAALQALGDLAVVQIPKAFATMGIAFTEQAAAQPLYMAGVSGVTVPSEANVRREVDVANTKPVKFLNGIVDDLKKLQEAGADRRSSPVEKAVYSLASGGASLLLAVGATVLTKNTSAAAAILSTIETSDTYLEARDAGKSPDEALAYALVSGTGTYYLEKAGIDYFLKNLKKPISSFLAKGFTGFLAEGTQEGTQQMWQNFIKQTGYDKSQKIMEGVLESFLVGGIVGGGATMVTSLATDDDMKEQEIKDRAVDKLTKQGVPSEAATAIVEQAFQYTQQKTSEIFNNMNGIGENRMIGYKGLNEKGVTPGVNQAAPLPETKPETQPLIEEAKKYKSAEEFIESREIVFHGSSVKGDLGKIDASKLSESGEMGKGFYLTPEADVAGYYGEKGSIMEFDVSGLNLKVTSQRGADGYVSEAVRMGSGDAYRKELIKQGFDGIEALDSKQIVVFPESVEKLRNKSQLTDIWNQANQKLPNTTLKTDGLAYLGGEKKISPEGLVKRDDKLKTPKQLQEKTEAIVKTDVALESIQEKLKPYDKEDLALFRKFSRMYEKRNGDVETLRKDRPDVVEKAVTRYREVNPNTKEADVESEAVDFIMNMATKEEVNQLKVERRLTKQEVDKLTTRMERIAKMAEGRAKIEAQQKVKSDIIEYAKLIPRSERGVLLVKVKNAKTNKDLEAAIAQIEEIQGKVELQEVKDKIKKEIIGTKLVKGGKAPKGKFAPEEQEFLNTVRKYLNDESGAGEYILNTLEKKDGDLDYQQSLLNQTLLDLSGQVEDLNRALDIIKAMKEEGGIKNALKKFESYQQVENVVEDFEKIVGGSETTRGRKELSLGTRIRFAIDNVGAFNFALKDYADAFDSLDKNTEPFEGDLVNHVNLSKPEQKVADLKERWVKEANDLLVDSYGLKGKLIGRKILNKVNEDNKVFALTKDGVLKPVKTITPEEYFEFADGKSDKIILTKAELRKLYAEMQDETLTKSFKQAHGYTDEVFKAVDKAMTPEDKAFVEGMFKIYNNSIYPEINKVFRKLNHVNLPKNLKYSPIKRVGYVSNEMAMSEGIGGMMQGASMSKGSLISRKDVVLEIAMQSDISAMLNHIEEMSHYAAFAEKMKVLRTAFADPRVKKSVEQNAGDGGLKLLSGLRKTLDRVVTQGKETSDGGWALNALRKNYVIASLALKAKVALNQMTGFVGYAEKMPMGYFGKEVAKMLNPMELKKAHDFFTKYSPAYRARAISFDRDLSEVANSTVAKRFANKGSIVNAIMVNVKIGDKGSVLLGGYPYYKYQFQQIQKKYPDWSTEKVREKAILNFEKFTNETMQSSNVSDLTLLQSNKNSLLRFMTTYMSNPILYFQKEWAYARAFVTGRGSRWKNLKGFLLFHSVLPVIYQAVANLFGDDDDDKANYIRAAILGNFNALPLIGEGIDALSRVVTNAVVDEGSKLDIYPARGTIFSDITKQTINAIGAASKLAEDKTTAYEAAKDISELLEPSLGIPSSTLFNMYEGVEKFMDKQYADGALMFMGYTPYVLDQNNKPSSSSGGSDYSKYKDKYSQYSNKYSKYKDKYSKYKQ